MDTVIPQSRIERETDKHLHDMVQKYSSGAIYIRTLEFKYQGRTELCDYHEQGTTDLMSG